MTNLISIAALVVLLVGIGSGHALAQPHVEGAMREANLSPPPFTALIAPGVVWRQPIDETNTSYIRLHFTDIDDRSTTEYAVVILNFRGDVVLEYPKKVFGVLPDLWTKVVPGDRLRIEVRAALPPSGLRFQLKEYAFERPGGEVLSIVGRNDLEPIDTYAMDPDISRRARAVGKLVFEQGGVPKSCTAFLVSETTALTNEHCIDSVQTCRTAVAIFGYHKPTDTGDQYGCTGLVVAPDRNLDFALIRLEGRPGAADKWGALEVRGRALTPGEAVYIIQHPAGEPKQISRKECTVARAVVKGRGADLTDFSHTCDTKNGSSGSPVLDANHHVVGLHHLGFSAGDWATVNRAVQIGRIPNISAP